jgi:hypothetical protein
VVVNALSDGLHAMDLKDEGAGIEGRSASEGSSGLESLDSAMGNAIREGRFYSRAIHTRIGGEMSRGHSGRRNTAPIEIHG